MDKIRGSNTGVYAGTMCDDHKHHLFQDIDSIPKYAATGSSAAVLANRVSWFFDLAGPSITLDTACSSSLTALHIACQGLILRETSMVRYWIKFYPDMLALARGNDELLTYQKGNCWRYKHPHRSRGTHSNDANGISIPVRSLLQL